MLRAAVMMGDNRALLGCFVARGPASGHETDMTDVIRSRKVPGLATWPAVLLLVLGSGSMAIEFGSYVVAVRTAQARAEETASRMAETLSTRRTVGAPAPTRRVDALRAELRVAGATDRDDLGAVRVEASSDWSSPLFGLHAPISTSATAGILPGAGPGAPLRIVMLR